MENKIKLLFDFQGFQQNSHLAQVIAQTENHYGKVLGDDELSFVNAAGEYSALQHRKDGDDFDV